MSFQYLMEGVVSPIIYLLGNGLLRHIKRSSDRKMTFISDT